MKVQSLARVWPSLLLLVAAVTVQAALVAGGSAYTKRIETKLLAEPKPLAATVGKIGFAKKIKIEEAAGAWLRVSDGKTSGWVFSGNLAENPPEEIKGADGLPLLASQTTATAAARPLGPEATAYANRHNLTNAREDLDWMINESAKVKPADIDDFLKAQKKGDFQ